MISTYQFSGAGAGCYKWSFTPKSMAVVVSSEPHSNYTEQPERFKKRATKEKLLSEVSCSGILKSFLK